MKTNRTKKTTNARIVLVVEDDADAADAIGYALELEGYEVRRATDGVDGLDSLYEEPKPAAVLLDLMMPDLDGWGFLKAKRQSAEVAEIPVVVFSALLEREARKEPEGLDGSLRFVRKPAPLEALLAVVEEATRRG